MKHFLSLFCQTDCISCPWSPGLPWLHSISTRWLQMSSESSFIASRCCNVACRHKYLLLAGTWHTVVGVLGLAPGSFIYLLKKKGKHMFLESVFLAIVILPVQKAIFCNLQDKQIIKIWFLGLRTTKNIIISHIKNKEKEGRELFCTKHLDPSSIKNW